MADVQPVTINLENQGLMVMRPGDVLPPGYLTSYLNMTANKTGFIESRGGTSLVSGTNLGAPVSAQGRILINGTPYIYQGAANSLYRAFSQIETGFSGNPLTFREAGSDEAITPTEIAFDSVVRYKDNGTTTTNFGIAGPMAAASAVAAATIQKTIDLFEYSTDGAIQAAWTEASSCIGITINSNNVNPFQGSYSGKTLITSNCAATFTRTVSLNLSDFVTPGDSTDNDYISIAISCDVLSQLSSLQLLLDVDPSINDFAHNYYTADVTAQITGTTGTSQWTQVFVRKADFTRIGTSSNDWANVAAVRIAVASVGGAINLGMDDFIMQTGTNLNASNYQWIYRYRDEVTNSVSPFSPDMFEAQTITATNATVTVRNPRDTQVTHIQLYRLGGANAIYSFVLEQVVTSWTGTTTILDTVPDQDLGDTADLTQVELANLLQTPSQTCTEFMKTTNGGSTYTDYTSNVSDDNAGTYADLSSLNTVGGNNWVVCGADGQFRQILVVMDANVNTNTSVLTMQYWNGTAWRVLQNQTDGTAAGGKTLAQGGTIQFDFPTDWTASEINNVQGFYVRFSVSAQLSGAVHITEIRIGANAFNPTVCEIHNGRIWFDDSTKADRVWYSERFAIETVLTDDFIVSSVPGGGDPIVRPYALDDQLFLFSTKTVQRVIGSDSSSFQPIATGAEVGLFSKYAICKGRGQIFYRAYDGIYSLNTAGYAQKITLPLDPLFHGIAGGTDASLQPIDNTHAITETLEFFNAKLHFGYTATNGNRYEIVMDLDTGRFEQTDRSATSYLRLDDVGQFYAGSSDGHVYLVDSGNTDNGAAIPIRFRTGYIDFGIQSQSKQITEILIDCDLAGQSVTFYADFDNGLGTSQSAILTNSSRGPVYLPLADDTQCRNVALRLDSNNNGALVKFYKVTIFFIVLPTLLTKMPTDWDDIGYAGDKRLRQLQLEIDTQGNNVSVAVQVDGATTQTLTVNTPIRQIVPNSLAANMIGKLTRLIMSGTGPFRYYTHQFEFLKDPLQTTRYDTFELDFGYTRLKFIRRVWVAGNTPATVTMTIYVDEVEQYTDTFDLVSANGWVKQELRLRPGLKGTVFRFVFTSTEGFKLFLDQSDVEWRPLADQRGYERAAMARQT